MVDILSLVLVRETYNAPMYIQYIMTMLSSLALRSDDAYFKYTVLVKYINYKPDSSVHTCIMLIFM